MISAKVGTTYSRPHPAILPRGKQTSPVWFQKWLKLKFKGNKMSNKFTDAVFQATFPDIKLGGKYPKTVTAPTLKLVAFALAWRTNNDTGHCFPSYRTIAKDAQCSYMTAVRAVAALEQAGFIVKHGTKGGRRASNTYIFDLNALEETVTQGDRKKISKSETVTQGDGTSNSGILQPSLRVTAPVTQGDTNSAFDSSGNSSGNSSATISSFHSEKQNQPQEQKQNQERSASPRQVTPSVRQDHNRFLTLSPECTPERVNPLLKKYGGPHKAETVREIMGFVLERSLTLSFEQFKQMVMESESQRGFEMAEGAA